MAPGKPSFGQNQQLSNTSEPNSLDFIARQVQNLMSTATIVRVESITNKGEVKEQGTMTVTPLIDMVDGRGTTTKHETINNVIYTRNQVGDRAIIMDPRVGDLGLVVFADRDISAAKKSKKQSPPGSRRRFDMADAIYVATLLGGVPNVYIRFKDNGTIIIGYGPEASAVEVVVASDHAQMKKRGVADLHLTIDAANGLIIAGQALTIAPDPFPGD